MNIGDVVRLIQTEDTIKECWMCKYILAKDRIFGNKCDRKGCTNGSRQDPIATGLYLVIGFPELERTLSFEPVLIDNGRGDRRWVKSKVLQVASPMERLLFESDPSNSP